MGLAIGKTAEKGHSDYGTALGNAQKLDTAQAVWNIFTAFGSMAFAYSYVRMSCLRPHFPAWPASSLLGFA